MISGDQYFLRTICHCDSKPLAFSLEYTKTHNRYQILSSQKLRQNCRASADLSTQKDSGRKYLSNAYRKPTYLCINHHLDAFDGSVLVEQLAYLVLRGICVQSKDSYAAACLWMFLKRRRSLGLKGGINRQNGLRETCAFVRDRVMNVRSDDAAPVAATPRRNANGSVGERRTAGAGDCHSNRSQTLIRCGME